MAGKKYHLAFTPELVNEPITFTLAREHDVVVNILRAEVTEHGGTLIMDIAGDDAKIDAAVEFLRSKGIDVRGLERTVVRDLDRCTDCSMCVSVCPVKAYRLDRGTWEVQLDRHRCIACGLCVDACPAAALRMDDVGPRA